MTDSYAFKSLRQIPKIKARAAQWFSDKWGIPQDEYLACMDAYLALETEYGWYLCMHEGEIVGGLGIIENDFHDRKDLAPNICALYVEAEHRNQGIAGKLLNMAVEDMASKGILKLYLITELEGFYERYGWSYLCMVTEDDGGGICMYEHRQAG